MQVYKCLDVANIKKWRNTNLNQRNKAAIFSRAYNRKDIFCQKNGGVRPKARNFRGR